MKLLRTIRSESAMDNYRSSLGERLGWAIFRSFNTFSPVHAVRHDREEGPVAIIADDVFLVEEEDSVYPSETEARDVFWGARQ